MRSQEGIEICNQAFKVQDRHHPPRTYNKEVEEEGEGEEGRGREEEDNKEEEDV